MYSKVYALLGLAKKAGRLVAGEDTCIRAIKSRSAFLVIVAEDASDNTKKEFVDACSYRNVDCLFFGQKVLLGKYIGKELRSVIAILDKGFAKALKKIINNCSIQVGGGPIEKS